MTAGTADAHSTDMSKILAYFISGIVEFSKEITRADQVTRLTLNSNDQVNVLFLLKTESVVLLFEHRTWCYSYIVEGSSPNFSLILSRCNWIKFRSAANHKKAYGFMMISGGI